MEYSKEDLIQICHDGVVPFRDWTNRDSYSAQVNLESIYCGLMANIPYSLKIEDTTIWINFEEPTEDQRNDLCKYSLPIDSLDDYREEFGYEDEMFDGNGIDWYSTWLGGYIPTRERLDSAGSGDWY